MLNNNNLNLWLNANIKQIIKNEINNLDFATKEDSFYTNLVFGTACL